MADPEVILAILDREFNSNSDGYPDRPCTITPKEAVILRAAYIDMLAGYEHLRAHRDLLALEIEGAINSRELAYSARDQAYKIRDEVEHKAAELQQRNVAMASVLKAAHEHCLVASMVGITKTQEDSNKSYEGLETAMREYLANEYKLQNIPVPFGILPVK